MVGCRFRNGFSEALITIQKHATTLALGTNCDVEICCNWTGIQLMHCLFGSAWREGETEIPPFMKTHSFYTKRSEVAQTVAGEKDPGTGRSVLSHGCGHSKGRVQAMLRII